jgi:surfactin synthase thioesterase subunit
MPDGPFVAGLRRLGGTPEELLADRRVMGMLMPGLRADFRLNDGYRHRPGPPLACPVTTFGGRQDHVVDEPELRAWREHTTGPFTSQTFEGGHFFLHSARDELLGAIGAALTGPVRSAQEMVAR